MVSFNQSHGEQGSDFENSTRTLEETKKTSLVAMKSEKRPLSDY